MQGFRVLVFAFLIALSFSLAPGQQAPLTQDRVSARLRELFPSNSNASKDISEALQAAAKDHKRVLLVFGASWCFDCFALDYRFHQSDIEPLVNSNYHVVHVDIGQHDKNLDIAKKYDTPVEAIPAVAVLSSSGKLLHSQKSHEFSSARSLDPHEIVNFLQTWKPKA
ncbi:MAG TPA: thioredoxin family protein [Terriglobales bacterium]|nr:thioredoxin family protein [Terriglobales bacterium]